MGMLRILKEFQGPARFGQLEKHGAVLVGLGNDHFALPVEVARVPTIQIKPGP